MGNARNAAACTDATPGMESAEDALRDDAASASAAAFRRGSPARRAIAAEAAGLYLDYSKNRITDETLRLLLDLAGECGLRARIDAMFRGEKINVTERRAVLHVALRAPKDERILVDGVDVVPAVHAVLDQMAAFSDRIRSGQWLGHTGKRIRNVVNIGLGGSDLGPVMAYQALRHYSQRDLRFRFVSNVDATDFVEATRDLDAEETLFIISSKTFTTLETVTNAHAARAWSLRTLGDERAVGRHFVAVSTNAEEVAKFGIESGQHVRLLGLGRRPLFDGFRDRAVDDDRHRPGAFPRDARGLPRDGRAFPHRALRAQPAGAHGIALRLVQQLLRRANGGRAAVRSISRTAAGLPAATDDGEQRQARHARRRARRLSDLADLWGERGTNGQHSFYQLIHQGTKLVPCDFIGFCQTLNPLGDQHDLLMANLFAQTEALAFGKTEDEVKAEGVPDWLAPHRGFDGNRPTNTILAERLTPQTLGALVALYEHSVFTQGVIWDIDSFDQWGVELGKVLAKQTIPELASRAEPKLTHDSSTNALIRRYRRLKQW